jgi:hypothetical protein
MPPLHLPGVPVVGHDGQRQNVTQLFHVVSALIPRGRRVRMDIAHDDGCPAGGRERRLFTGAMDDCTCETVDITLHLINPKES